jgi:hypothetical protein
VGLGIGRNPGQGQQGSKFQGFENHGLSLKALNQSERQFLPCRFNESKPFSAVAGRNKALIWRSNSLLKL